MRFDWRLVGWILLFGWTVAGPLCGFGFGLWYANTQDQAFEKPTKMGEIDIVGPLADQPDGMTYDDVKWAPDKGEGGQ